MALTIKHRGFNKWQVLDGETVVSDGLTKQEAQTQAGLEVDPVKPEAPRLATEGGIPTHAPDGRELTEMERRRLYEKSMEAGVKGDADRELAPYKALLFRDHPDEVAAALWRQIEPILRAGGEGIRRNVGRNMKGRAAA